MCVAGTDCNTKCNVDGVRCLQEATYSPFCIARAQASEHRKGATKGEAKVFESWDLQVFEELSSNHDDQGEQNVHVAVHSRRR